LIWFDSLNKYLFSTAIFFYQFQSLLISLSLFLPLFPSSLSLPFNTFFSPSSILPFHFLPFPSSSLSSFFYLSVFSQGILSTRDFLIDKLKGAEIALKASMNQCATLTKQSRADDEVSNVTIALI
jgi:hypothetical protein